MRKLTTVLSTALLSLTIAGSAFAQTAAPAQTACEGRAGGRGHRLERMTQRFDANGNGQLEVSELPAPMQARIGTADTNRDGVLSADEMRAAFQASRAEVRAQMDADHDGTISDAERATFREARFTERFARLDVNGDGVVTAAEVGAQRWQFIGRADANNDGSVTREELRAAHVRHGMHGARHGHGRRA
jgi:Ca2+-binding EF-hand superfamily protein